MILMLDDEPVFMQSYKDALEFDGYEVRLLGSEEDLLRELRITDAVEVLILDVMFPGDMDAGLHTLSRVRELFGRIPIIVLSNRSDVSRIIVEDHYTLCTLKRNLSPKQLVNAIRCLVTDDK